MSVQQKPIHPNMENTTCVNRSSLSLSCHDLIFLDFRDSRMSIQSPDMILGERRRKSLDELMLVRNFAYHTSVSTTESPTLPPLSLMFFLTLPVSLLALAERTLPIALCWRRV